MTKPMAWFVAPRPHPSPKARLLCFPFAGGAAGVFRPWAARLPSEVELWAAELPGRASRFTEPPIADLGALLDELEQAVVSAFDRPFAFFGHSMGAMIAFELTRRLRARGNPLPSRLFVSAHRAPHLPERNRRFHDLSDAELMAEMRRMGGTPPEALDDAELLGLMLPVLRADCRAIETWKHCAAEPLTLPVVAFGGVDDPDVTASELHAWADHTTGPFAAHQLPGGHFFLHDAASDLLHLIHASLTGLERGPR
jgi:medium-chain acyl-[acyl-carrier-protein] hydrolase